MCWVDPMAFFIATNQRTNSSYVSVTDAPAYVLTTLYGVSPEAAVKAARRVSQFTLHRCQVVAIIVLIRLIPDFWPHLSVSQDCTCCDEVL